MSGDTKTVTILPRELVKALFGEAAKFDPPTHPHAVLMRVAGQSIEQLLERLAVVTDGLEGLTKALRTGDRP